MNKSQIEPEELHSVGLLVSRMAVRRALRKVPEMRFRTAYIIGLNLIEERDQEIFECALTRELAWQSTDKTYRPIAPDFHYFREESHQSEQKRRKMHKALSVWTSIEENQRVIGVSTPNSPMTTQFRNVAEAIFDTRIESSFIKAALIIARDIFVCDEIAERLARYCLSDLTIAFRGNRPLEAALQLLESLPDVDARVSSGKYADANACSQEIPTLEELSGYGEAKDWGLELSKDLKDWMEGNLPWSDVDKGVLFEGKSGTGKTRFVRSLAKTCKAHFVECSLAKAQAKGHLGDMLGAIRHAFTEAKANTPAILFIDEFDSIGDRTSLTDYNAEYSRKVITGMLEFIDGSDPREGVVVVGASNSLNNIDDAFLRPGRLERVISIRPPNLSDRQKILLHYLGTPIPDKTLLELGKRTEGWTGADLEKFAREVRRKTRRSGVPLDGRRALETLSGAVQEVCDVELKRFAVHETGHVIAAFHLLKVLPVSVSIHTHHRVDSSVAALSGGVTVFPRRNGLIRLQGDYLNEIAIALAGQAAETLYFGDASDGAGVVSGSDLEFASILTARMLASSGLAENLVFLSNDNQGNLAQLIGQNSVFANKCDAVLKQQMKTVSGLLAQNMSMLRAMAKLLLKRKRLSQIEVATLLGANTNISSTPTTKEKESVN